MVNDTLEEASSTSDRMAGRDLRLKSSADTKTTTGYWLGPNGIRTEEVPGEWPVSYHGTNTNLMLGTGIKAGPRAKFGKGVYRSPSLEMVEKLYAKEFTHKRKSYKIVLQNHVNPDQRNGHLQIIPASQTGAEADYWLSSTYFTQE